MSRDIDTSDLSALSKKDLEYLRDRGRLTPEQERELLGDSTPEPFTARSVADTPHTGDVNTNNTNPNKASGDPAPTPDEDDSLPDNYEDWKVSQLEKEIDARNAERGDGSDVGLIAPASGRKNDLIAALAADDEANGGE